ncbi:hypothetical protein [Psychroserpens sp.]|uniref:hypothetical protein n=1 Tax=Psychroserpens sp. TaxID=2020870 RepID=UPI002B266032|nr:hypothetical protein [Psychroserpens sp.]
MENLIEVKSAYNSLDKLCTFFKNESVYRCSKIYDTWEIRTDSNGQMEHCIVVKKSSMHAIKVFFVNEDTVKINYVIPNKLMNAYFGKSVKARQNIIEIATGVIKQALLYGFQKKAFSELEQLVLKAS